MKLKFHYRKDRKSPYEARWWSKRLRNGEERYVPQSRFFRSVKARQAWAKSFLKRIERYGTTSLAVDEKRLQRWMLADQIIGAVDPVKVALQWKDSAKKGSSISWSEAIKDYLWHLESLGREQYELNRFERIFSRFGESVNNSPIGEIDGRIISEWITSLPFALVTKHNYRLRFSAAFSYFVEKEWIEVHPVKKVRLGKVVTPEPKIASVEQTRRLFEANRKFPDACALIAAGCFGGMRASAVSRLENREIDSANRGILTPRRKTKKERRQFIQGHPKNLWAWLEKAPACTFAPRMPDERKAAEQWRIECKGRYCYTVAKAVKRAGLHPMPKNWARHSFVSYHVAAYENPGKTALIISHTDDPNVLYKSYYGVHDPDERTVTKAMGVEFFGISPGV